MGSLHKELEALVAQSLSEQLGLDEERAAIKAQEARLKSEVSEARASTRDMQEEQKSRKTHLLRQRAQFSKEKKNSDRCREEEMERVRTKCASLKDEILAKDRMVQQLEECWKSEQASAQKAIENRQKWLERRGISRAVGMLQKREGCAIAERDAEAGVAEQGVTAESGATKRRAACDMFPETKTARIGAESLDSQERAQPIDTALVDATPAPHQQAQRQEVPPIDLSRHAISQALLVTSASTSDEQDITRGADMVDEHAEPEIDGMASATEFGAHPDSSPAALSDIDLALGELSDGSGVTSFAGKRIGSSLRWDRRLKRPRPASSPDTAPGGAGLGAGMKEQEDAAVVAPEVAIEGSALEAPDDPGAIVRARLGHNATDQEAGLAVDAVSVAACLEGNSDAAPEVGVGLASLEEQEAGAAASVAEGSFDAELPMETALEKISCSGRLQ